MNFEDLYEELGLDIDEQINFDDLLDAYVFGFESFLYSEIDSSLYHNIIFLNGVIFGFQNFVSKLIDVQSFLLRKLSANFVNRYLFFQDLYKKNGSLKISKEAEVVCMTFDSVKLISEMGDFEGAEELVSGLLLNAEIICKQAARKSRGKEYGMEYFKHHN